MKCLGYITSWLCLAVSHELINHAGEILGVLLFGTLARGGTQSQESIAIEEVVNILAIQIIIHRQIMR
jgi:hypothetical protein